MRGRWPGQVAQPRVGQAWPAADGRAEVDVPEDAGQAGVEFVEPFERAEAGARSIPKMKSLSFVQAR